jgi:hypothetical protein
LSSISQFFSFFSSSLSLSPLVLFRSAVKDELKKIIGKVDEKVAKTNEHMSDVDGLISKIQGEVKKQLSTDGLQVSCSTFVFCFVGSVCCGGD